MNIMTLYQDDYGYALNFTVKNSDNTAFDLTGYTVNFVVWPPGTPGSPVINKVGTVVTATAGLCRYTVASNDFTATAEYYAEMQLSISGKVESTDPFRINVIESP